MTTADVLQEPLAPVPDPAAVSAAAAWRVCAAAVAQQPVMRVARDGRSFPARYQRPLAAEVPRSQPAAVPTWGRDGLTRLLVVDLDAARGDVAADADLVAARLTRCGASVVRDVSPSGGQHIYVLLAEPVSIAEMAPVARGLAAAAPSVDTTPMLNVAGGLIRPPGSRHRSGGWQLLLQPLPQVAAALSTPADREVWDRIQAAFPPPPAPPSPAPDQPASGGDVLDPLPGYHGQISGRYAQIATSGDWTGYPSPSEARQAVVWAAAAAGLTLATVAARVETGAWPGLRSLYTRYGRHQHAALARDWHKAVRFERARRDRARSTIHTCNTRRLSHSPSPGSSQKNRTCSISRSVRDWVSAVRLLEHRWRREPVVLLVLRALAQAAEQTGSTVVERGVRGLALATHLDPATVSRVLARLRAEQDPVIERDRVGRGTRPDAYRLLVPASAARSVERTPWRAGQTRALHPVARGLGRIAGWVWEELRGSRQGLSVRDLVDRVPYSRQAVHDALRTLASYDLAQHWPGGWGCGAAHPNAVATLIGADTEHQAVVQKYQEQRAAWIQYLIDRGRHALTPPATGPPTPPAPALPEPAPVSDPAEEQALKVLTAAFGPLEIVID